VAEGIGFRPANGVVTVAGICHGRHYCGGPWRTTREKKLASKKPPTRS